MGQLKTASMKHNKNTFSLYINMETQVLHCLKKKCSDCFECLLQCDTLTKNCRDVSNVPTFARPFVWHG